MAKSKYLIGYKFNKLTIIEFLGRRGNNNHYYYRCRCECGNIVDILSHHVQIQKSCGCMPRQMRKL